MENIYVGENQFRRKTKKHIEFTEEEKEKLQK